MATMQPPRSGVTVRMYRHGHGDCFLLAFRDDHGGAYYVLIDCGLLGGSAIDAPIRDIVLDIDEATGSHLHLVVMTHEHSDHVSGFNSARATFNGMQIDECFVAWTENPKDSLANKIRRDKNDVLIGLRAAGLRLEKEGSDTDKKTARRIEALFEFEVDPRVGARGPFAASIDGITNKRAMRYVEGRAREQHGVRYLSPHKAPESLPGVSGVRVFTLGPPRNTKRLLDEEPKEGEAYGTPDGTHLTAFEAESNYLLASALAGAPAGDRRAAHALGDALRPFSERHGIPLASKKSPFVTQYYGSGRGRGKVAWRRIDTDWLRAAEALALRLNGKVNNTSLVLAFDLPQSGRVLLFTGDAQRGNLWSWNRKEFPLPGGGTLTSDDLLGRTVLYKVGHHGSHNATLKKLGLEKMAKGDYADEFCALIPAHPAWAERRNGWIHPLPAILEALEDKAEGRVMISNKRLRRPSNVTAADWKPFGDRSRSTRLFHEVHVYDD